MLFVLTNIVYTKTSNNARFFNEKYGIYLNFLRNQS